MNIYQLLAFILYFAIVIGTGLFFFIKSKGGGDKDYFLGGRKMGSWVVALSAQASDMSGWLLMGLPGSLLAFGMGQIWIAVGLLIGTYLNWRFTAPRLRKFSKAANDSITIPQYLSNRFCTSSKVLCIVCAVVFLVCYTVYAASSFKACGTLFNSVFGLDTTKAIILAALIILAYTFLGGFSAVCWTDFFQGILMLGALLIAPIAATFIVAQGGSIDVAALGTTAAFESSAIALPENYWNLLPSGKFDWESISTILSGLAWGLGYFGMPHVLVRFMSIKNSSMIKKSRRIAMVWVVLAMCGAVAVGLIGRTYLPGLKNEFNSSVFIYMVQGIFPPFIAGILLSGILAASMSTADSQLLVSASAFTSDIYKPIIRKKAGNKEILWTGRFVVLLITVIAALIAINPNSGDIMNLVENAWAGFGSAFGPVIILSLFWKKFTYKGAVAGIIGGGLVDVVWLVFLSKSTGIYELLPGFIVGLICSIVFSKIGKGPSKEVSELYDAAIAETL